MSQARHTGSGANRAKSPKPPIASYGALSLKKKISPGRSAENAVAPGRQKLTSSNSGRARRNWYSLSLERAPHMDSGVGNAVTHSHGDQRLPVP
jgi:hypothetical protein